MTSNHSSNAAQVQGTNDSSVVSKLSMVNMGYQDDKYLKYFVQKPQRRSSLINRGYYLRTKVIRYVLESFVQEFSKQKQIISLGAGFDTSYFYLRDHDLLSNDWLFVEIDYADVINRKLHLARLNGLFPQSIDANTGSQVSIFRYDNYLAVGYDLRNAGGELTKILLNCDIDVNQFSLFLSEVVLTYLTSSQSSRVLSWINHSFTNAMTVIFEQMLPHDSFGIVMCRHFESLGSPLSSIHNFPTLQSQINRHKSLGFDVYSHTDLFSFFAGLPREEQSRIKNLEMFDEYEGWHLMSMHYFVLCSTNSNSDSMKKFCSDIFPSRNKLGAVFRNMTPSVQEAQNVNDRIYSLQLFGHSMCSYDDNNKLLMVGGFGIPPCGSSSSHQRLNCLTSFDLKTGLLSTSEHKISQALFSTMVKFNDKDGCLTFAVFGGRAAPNCASSKLRLIRLEKNPDNNGNLDVSVDNLTLDCESGPLARWRHSATVVSHIDSRHGASMIVIGGRDEKLVFSDCWNFNFETLKWSKVILKTKDDEKMPARHSHGSVWWKEKEKLVVSGGLDEESKPLNDIFVTDLSSELERLDVKPFLHGRYSHSSHVVRGHMLLLVGGVTIPSNFDLISSEQSVCDHIAVVDLKTATYCQTIVFPTSFLQHPIRVLCHASSVIETENDVKLAVVGGGSNCFSFGTAFSRTPLHFVFDV